jgi:hypothetical protein
MTHNLPQHHISCSFGIYASSDFLCLRELLIFMHRSEKPNSNQLFECLSLHDTENHSKMSHPLKRAIPFTVDV